MARSAGLVVIILLAGCSKENSVDISAPAGCSTDSDCIEMTELGMQPKDCAEAKCDQVNGTCRLVARDKDGDGHGTKSCKAADNVQVETGDDCDDADSETFPGSWDGPKSSAKPDRCDGRDQDCNGKIDDGIVNGASCKCVAGAQCAEFANGSPITGFNPAGRCKWGSRQCNPDGTTGSCVGAVGPTAESCNAEDDDCDGTKDEGMTWNGLSLGAACKVGLGACERTGSVVCQDGAANCSQSPGTPSGEWHKAPAGNGSWDWNCDGAVETEFLESSTYANPCAITDVAKLCKGFSHGGFCEGEWYSPCSTGGCGASLVKYRCHLESNGSCGNAGGAAEIVTQGCR